jgi:hypothetical protein
MTTPLTDDDQARLAAIAQTRDPVTLSTLMHRYYGDKDRAERTPRDLLYLHLGLLCGVIERLAREQMAARARNQ